MESNRTTTSIFIVNTVSLGSEKDQFIDAAAKGNLKKLLEFSSMVAIDSKNSKGETPLIAATIGGNTRAVFFLLSKGADVSIMDDTGNTALHHATVLEDLDVIDKLLVKSKPNLKNRDGQTIIHVAVKENKPKTLEHLMKIDEINLNEQDANGNTALHIAVNNGNLKMLCKLLTKPVDISLYNSDGKNPLNLAVENDEIEIFQILLETKSGLDLLSTRTTYGESNLEIAIRERRSKIVKYLLTAEMHPENMIGFEIDRKFGATALHWAVLQFDVELVHQILSINSNVLNVRDKLGKTPLDHLCFIYGFETSVKEKMVEIAIRLIVEGADMSLIQNKEGLFKLIRDAFQLKFNL